MRQRDLAIRLSRIPAHPDPVPGLEQYATPSDVAADLLYRALGRGDIAHRRVVDLGSGTGILAIGASLLGAAEVVGHVIGADHDDLLGDHRRWLHLSEGQLFVVIIILIFGIGKVPPSVPSQPTPLLLAAISIPVLGLLAWAATRLRDRLQRPGRIFVNLWLGSLAVVWGAIAAASRFDVWWVFACMGLMMGAMVLGAAGITASLRDEARRRSPDPHGEGGRRLYAPRHGP